MVKIRNAVSVMEVDAEESTGNGLFKKIEIYVLSRVISIDTGESKHSLLFLFVCK